MTAHFRSKASAAIAEAWSGASDNREAADRLAAMMDEDADLYREIMAPFKAQAAMLAVQRHKIARRAYIWSRPAAPDDRVTMMASANAASLLDMRLPSGVRLGDATAKEVAAAAVLYRMQEGQARAKAVFLEAVAARIKRGKRVADCLSADDLRGLRDAG